LKRENKLRSLRFFDVEEGEKAGLFIGFLKPRVMFSPPSPRT